MYISLSVNAIGTIKLYYTPLVNSDQIQRQVLKQPPTVYLMCFSADINECVSTPCVNGGTCVDQVNGYMCNCIPGYTGIHCQTGETFRDIPDKHDTLTQCWFDDWSAPQTFN